MWIFLGNLLMKALIISGFNNTTRKFRINIKSYKYFTSHR